MSDAKKQKNPTIMGVSMKHISLVTLTFQNSALILIMHYSRVMPSTSKTRFFPSTAVLLNEILKLSICVAVAFIERRKRDGPYITYSQTASSIYWDVFRGDSWKVAIPAALYTLQNTLQYVAVSNLDAATFQVTYQLKILTTAIFSVIMLNRRLSWKRWLSLLMLTVGIAIVQLPGPKPPKLPRNSAPAHSLPKRALELASIIASKHTDVLDTAYSVLKRRSIDHDGTAKISEPAIVMNSSLGLTAVIFACTISGIAGVYFEKVLKAYFIGVWYKDGPSISHYGFFNGYNYIVWTAIAFQAIGGIVVALCVNFADNIAKNFATSISILISCIASIYFFDFKITTNFLLGASIVLYATYLYSTPDRKRPAPVYIPFEKTTTEPLHSGKFQRKDINKIPSNSLYSSQVGTQNIERSKSPAPASKLAAD